MHRMSLCCGRLVELLSPHPSPDEQWSVPALLGPHVAAFIVLKDGVVAIRIDSFRQGIERGWWETLTNVYIHIPAGPGACGDLPWRRTVVGCMGDAVTTPVIAISWCLYSPICISTLPITCKRTVVEVFPYVGPCPISSLEILSTALEGALAIVGFTAQ